MKKVILLLILFSSFFYNASFASHAMGGDITYRCLGNNQYEVTFTFYRDCSGIPAPSIMNLSIQDGLSGIPTSVNLSPTPFSPTQLHTVCPTATTTCSGGMYTGIEKWVYQGVITLAGPSANWIISHTENARNTAITTITGAGSDNLFVYAVINNTNGLCNNSPTFNGDPVPIICMGNPFCLTQGTYDIESDSLSYQLITPRTGAALSDTVTYLSGFSSTQPVISNPPITFNSFNGEICMLPQQPDVSPMAILISEYREGVLIGQIERDIQLTVISCNNYLPQATGINGIPGNNSLNVCATLQNCFFVTAVDADISNTTFISWDGSIPSMSAIHTFGSRDTIYFCFTPSDSDTIGSPHCFTATVTDDNCPYYGIQSSTYCLSVQPSRLCNPNSINSPDNHQPDVKIYPQPAKDHFTLNTVKIIGSGKNYFVLKNILGETVFRIPVNEQVMTINLNKSIDDGIYIACVTDSGGKILWKDKLVLLH